jgi:hypothetical protein
VIAFERRRDAADARRCLGAERLPAFLATDIGRLVWLKSSFSVRLPTKSQTILPMIVFISSNKKARSVWERTLQREQTLKEKGGRGRVVRRLADRNDVPRQA